MDSFDWKGKELVPTDRGREVICMSVLYRLRSGTAQTHTLVSHAMHTPEKPHLFEQVDLSVLLKRMEIRCSEVHEDGTVDGTIFVQSQSMRHRGMCHLQSVPFARSSSNLFQLKSNPPPIS